MIGPEKTYNTNDLVQSISVKNNVRMAVGYYYRGQLLGRLTDTGVFTKFDKAGTDGSQNISAVVLNDCKITAENQFTAVCRGEFNKDGVARVMAALSPALTIDDVIIGKCWDVGIILN